MFKKALKLIVLVILLSLIYIVWQNRWWFYDEYRLYGYNPPTAIANIASQDQLTDYGRRLLYVYHPDIETSTIFNSNCRVTNVAIVLGCTVIGKGIYLYDVQDPALNGVEQVTAAYEMLHVAYSRLPSSQLKTINQLVMSTYNKLSVNDPLLKAEYDSYLKTEGPGALENEMHSTLGAEIATLPPELENYYKKFFVNRQTIVNFANQYESAFRSRETEVANDDLKLASLKNQIDSLNALLASEYTSIKNQQSEMNSMRDRGDFNGYNSQVSSFNNSVNSYNSQVVTDHQLVEQYNSLVAQRNAIAISENKLSNEINSLSATSPAN